MHLHMLVHFIMWVGLGQILDPILDQFKKLHHLYRLFGTWLMYGFATGGFSYSYITLYYKTREERPSLATAGMDVRAGICCGLII